MALLTINSKLSNNGFTIYCHEDYAAEALTKYESNFRGRNHEQYEAAELAKFKERHAGANICKDMLPGQICRVRVVAIDGKEMLVESEASQSIYLDLQKESRFLEKQNINKDNLLPGHQLDIMIDSVSVRGDYSGSMESAFRAKLKADLHASMKSDGSAYKVTVKSINQGGFIVDLAGMDCFMPGSLAAANKISNFEAMLGKEIYVMVENYLESSDMFVVSNKKYIQWILPHKAKELSFVEEKKGTVTGVMKYGAFIEWDEIFTGLLHESEYNGLAPKPGEEVSFWVKEIKEGKDSKDIRIILSQRGPNPELMVYQRFKEKYEGQVFGEARVKDVKPFGIFVEMEDVVGMFSPREFKRSGKKPKEGELLDAFVKHVDVQAKKIFLKAADEEEAIDFTTFQSHQE